MFNVLRSNHMERLVSALGALLAEPLESPMAAEIISVQSLGMRQWLSMQIADSLGICANTDFPFPRDLMALLFKNALGEDTDSMQLGVDQLTWSIMSCLPDLADSKEFAPLKNFIQAHEQGGDREIRLFQLSHRIADTFDQYTIYRPDMIKAWDEGKTPGWIDPQYSWQPMLWQKATQALPQLKHFTALAHEFMQAMENESLDHARLPSRISLFGISTLPPLYLDILKAASRHMEINLFYLNPSRQYWADIRSEREILRELEKHSATTEDFEKTLHLEEGNALLASMGRIGRDFQYILEAKLDYQEPEEDLFEENHHDSPKSPTLLSTIQSDILDLRQSDPLDHADDSLAFHSCHSPMREVEVLRDQLRYIFEHHHDIHPHDVIVMTPDIEKYAPAIDAVFGTLDGLAKIPYSISDRSLGKTSPVIESFMAILHMDKARTSIVEVFDLLSRQAIRERFGMDPQEVDQAHHWARQAGVRWGKDARHRESFGQPPLEQNTWRFGMERLFLGFALPSNDELMFRGRLGYDEIEGADACVLGKFAEFCQVLFRQQDIMSKPRTPRDWEKSLLELMEAMTQDKASHGFYHQHIRQVLGELARDAELGAFDRKLGLRVIRDYLKNKFEQVSTSQKFMSGGVTFCKLLPMRSIPHKVVCLMGMNYSDYPREQRGLGFDLVANRSRPGDRSIRNDDRYQFLEALLSAREKFIITYVGQDIFDNAPLAPSVLVSELQDYLDKLIAPEQKAKLELRHPLQPFSPGNFNEPGSGAFCYDADYHQAALSFAKNEPAPEFFASPLPKDEIPEVPLRDLVDFFKLPVRYLLNRRLGIYLPPQQEAEPEREPMVLGGLEKYTMGEWLLRAHSEPEKTRKAQQILEAKGVMPIGEPGILDFQDMSEQVEQVLGLMPEDKGAKTPQTLEVRIQLEENLVLTGRLTDIWPKGRITAGYGRIDPKRLLDLWIRHLALCCTKDKPCPDTSMLAGYDADKNPLLVRLGKTHNARALLQDLVELFLLGQSRPILFFPKTSFARAVGNENKGAKKFLKYPRLEKQWSGDFISPGESQEAYTRLVFADHTPWSLSGMDTGMDFSSLANRVFGPLMANIQGVEP